MRVPWFNSRGSILRFVCACVSAVDATGLNDLVSSAYRYEPDVGYMSPYGSDNLSQDQRGVSRSHLLIATISIFGRSSVSVMLRSKPAIRSLPLKHRRGPSDVIQNRMLTSYLKDVAFRNTWNLNCFRALKSLYFHPLHTGV